MPKSYTCKERGRQNEMLYGRGAKKLPPRMLRVKQLSIDTRNGDMREGKGKKRKGKGKGQLPQGQKNFTEWTNTIFYCPREVPPSDLEFLEDQKGVRKLRRNPKIIPLQNFIPSPIIPSGVIESDSSESDSEPDD